MGEMDRPCRAAGVGDFARAVRFVTVGVVGFLVLGGGAVFVRWGIFDRLGEALLEVEVDVCVGVLRGICGGARVALVSVGVVVGVVVVVFAGDDDDDEGTEEELSRLAGAAAL